MWKLTNIYLLQHFEKGASQQEMFPGFHYRWFQEKPYHGEGQFSSQFHHARELRRQDLNEQSLILQISKQIYRSIGSMI